MPNFMQVLDIEGSDGHWSLVSRLMLANEVLDAADAAGMAADRPMTPALSRPAFY